MDNHKSIEDYFEAVRKKIWKSNLASVQIPNSKIDLEDEIGYGNQKLPEVIHEATNYIKGHLFDKDLTVRKLKEKRYGGSHNFSTTFGYYIGVPPKKFITIHRLKAAKLVLKNKDFEDFPILYIAQKLGFSGKGAFNHAFKKYIGIPPSRWREQNTD